MQPQTITLPSPPNSLLLKSFWNGVSNKGTKPNIREIFPQKCWVFFNLDDNWDLAHMCCLWPALDLALEHSCRFCCIRFSALINWSYWNLNRIGVLQLDVLFYLGSCFVIAAQWNTIWCHHWLFFVGTLNFVKNTFAKINWVFQPSFLHTAFKTADIECNYKSEMLCVYTHRKGFPESLKPQMHHNAFYHRVVPLFI